jgi:hypothetical protein
MTAVHELGGPAAWTGDQMRQRSDWLIELGPGQAAELTAALKAADRPGVELADVGKGDFPLPTLAPLLAGLVEELMSGRGFALLRGVPVESLTEHQAELMAWGIGLHVGIPLQQGAGAKLLMHVRDQGIDPKSPLARGYQHRAFLNYHTDTPDVVALLCIRPAMEGGVSTIVSSVAVHDEIVRTRPDLAAVMYEPWWHDRRRGDGPDSFFQCPIYAVDTAGTKLFAYYGPDYVRSAPRGAHVPDLTPRQVEAMELLERLNNEPRFVLDMHFRPGDVQFLSNYVVMHGRTSYVDFPDPDLKRDLIRLWLTIDRDLGLPASISERGLMSRTAAFRRPA